jgi:hypothetical protein
MPYEEEDTCMP